LKLLHPEMEVETNLEDDLLNILGSPLHLSKSLMNLVANAAEAMPEGGSLSLTTENRYLDRPVKGYDDVEEGDYVVIEVADTGTGISPEDMERIFEPFYTKKQMGRSGSGLGMTVVWGTVKDYDGYIELWSEEGKGTVLTLFFPVTRQELSQKQSGVPIEDYSGSGESILVVDDVEEQRKLALGILTRLGYEVATVASGEEAVEYLQESSVDLLVLDMIMDPGMDGLDTYRGILERHPGQKAVIASGFSETERVEEAQRLGAGAYVKKPYLMEKLGMAVRAELDSVNPGPVSEEL
jgi:two-component system, cell cycle sensor histidine kinase and response regulator CckA